MRNATALTAVAAVLLAPILAAALWPLGQAAAPTVLKATDTLGVVQDGQPIVVTLAQLTAWQARQKGILANKTIDCFPLGANRCPGATAVSEIVTDPTHMLAPSECGRIIYFPQAATVTVPAGPWPLPGALPPSCWLGLVQQGADPVSVVGTPVKAGNPYNWWAWINGAWQWQQSGDPRRADDDPSPQAPPAATVPDATGKRWSLLGGQVAQGGVVDPITHDVIQLVAYGGVIYQRAGTASGMALHSVDGLNVTGGQSAMIVLTMMPGTTDILLRRDH